MYLAQFVLASMLVACLITQSPAAQMRTLLQENISWEEQRAWITVCTEIKSPIPSLQQINFLLQQYPTISNFQTDETDSTLLIMAIRRGYLEIVRSLIVPGANLNLKDLNGRTALMYAAERDYRQITQSLIAAGANLNIQNRYGETALMIAMFHKRTNRAQALVAGGADLNLQNKKGQTALQIAQQLKCGFAMERAIKKGLAERQQRLDNLQKVKQEILNNTDLAQDPVSLIAEYVGTRENIDSQIINSSIDNNNDNTQPRKCIVM